MKKIFVFVFFMLFTANAVASETVHLGNQWIKGRDVTGIMTNYLLQVGLNKNNDYDITGTADYGGMSVKPSFRLEGTTNSLYGLTVKPSLMTNGSPRTLVYNTGVFVERATSTADLSINHNYGVRIQSRLKGANKYGMLIEGASGNTSGENVGLYVGAVSNGGSGSAWGIYNVSKAYFGGQVSIKTSVITTGTGSPEGVIIAPIGSMFLRSDGGSGTTFYIKESGTGNTGWIAK